MSSARHRTLIAVSIVVLLAMILSFTLAWFAQLLVSRDNAIMSGAGTSSVELWGQSAMGGRFGGSFLNITAEDLAKTEQSPEAGKIAITQSYLAPAEDSTTAVASQYIPENYLYKIVGVATAENETGLVYEDGDKSKDYNRLLNDTGLLPKNQLKRRVIVYNSPAAPQNVSYNVTFPLQTKPKLDTNNIQEKDSYGNLIYETIPDSDLAEAFRVDVAKLTKTAGVSGVGAEEASGLTTTEGCTAQTVSGASGIDVTQLHDKSLTGTLKPGEFDVYEFTFTFLNSASNYYETPKGDTNGDMALKLDVKVVAKAGAETHYVRTAAELFDLLYPGTNNPGIKFTSFEQFQGDF